MAAEQLTLDFSVVKEVSIVETETRRILKRAQAKALGETRYYNGKPCTNGHLAERLTVNGACVECSNIRTKAAYWRNPDKFRAEALDRRNADVEKAREKTREWRAKNPDKSSAATRRWEAANKESYADYRRGYLKEQYKTNTLFRIALSVRGRVNRVLRGGKKPSSAVKSLGATLPVVRRHIESMFRDGMTWDNWGPVWQLDHIRPLCSFDLTDEIQFASACHYTNLQPLLVSENARKSGSDRKLSIRSQ